MNFNEGDRKHRELQALGFSIDTQATRLLSNPDWTQTELHFQASVGERHTLELSARTSSDSIRNEGWRDTRRVFLFRNDPFGMRSGPLMLDLNSIHWTAFASPVHEALAEFVESDERIISIITDGLAGAEQQRSSGSITSDISDKVTRNFADLLDSGVINQRTGINHTLADGSFVGVLSSSKAGDQPWNIIDDEAALQVHYKDAVRVIDFYRKRDGEYELTDSHLDEARNARYIYGDTRVLESDVGVIVFDLGDYAGKRQVLDEADRVMGFRDLKEDSLTLLSDALKRAAEERNL